MSITPVNKAKNDITISNKTSWVDNTFDDTDPKTFDDMEDNTFEYQNILVFNKTKNDITINNKDK